MRTALLVLCTLLWTGPALADDTESQKPKVQYLVPEMEGQSFGMSEGKRPYAKRLQFSPAFGQFGNSEYYAFRIGYNPTQWLGYEANLGHNPSESIHALVNSLNTVVRYPFPGRFQPYVSAGFGMMLIFPGAVFQADPVTRNVLSGGAGLEIYIRNDVALRGEIRGNTLVGGTSGDASSLSYREFTFGLTFYRSLGE